MASKPRKKTQPASGTEPPAASQRLISQPSVRVTTNWTPARIRSVQGSADSGNMQPVADLCDQMIRDDRFGQALQDLCDAVLGAELAWERALRSRTPADEAVPLEKEADDDWWERYSEAEYAQILIWREMLGFCWGRLTWIESTTSKRWVPMLQFWHPRHFRYDASHQQWSVRIDDQNHEEFIEPGEGGWVIFYRRGIDRPWADGQWRGIARWWMLKAYAISDWGVHSEKAARQVITADEGVSAEDRKALASDLYACSKDGVISLPHGFAYTLVEATANTRDIYNAQIDAANMAGTIAILGQNLTTEISDEGSRAAAETHSRKQGQKVRYVAESLSTSLRVQVMVPWANYNFGQQLPPWHVWLVEPPDDVAAKAVTLSTLADAMVKLKGINKAVPDQKLKDEFGLELEDLEPEPTPEPLQQPPGKKPPPPPAPRGQQDDQEGGLRLASGLPARQGSGFIASTIYADDVADESAKHTARDLQAFVGKLLGAIGSADDYDSIRAAVHAAYKDEAAPERLAELVEHAVVMADLAGRLGTHQDTD